MANNEAENVYLKPTARFSSKNSSIPITKSRNNLSKEISINIDTNKQTEVKNFQQYKIILTELRKELIQQIKNFDQALIDYESTTSRQDYEKLLGKYRKLENEYKSILSKKIELQSSLEDLIEINQQVKTQFDTLSVQKYVLSGSATPRPDWDRCSRVIDGGYNRWLEISNGKSSDELVDILVNELVGETKKIDKTKMAKTMKSKASYIDVFDKDTRQNKPVYNRCLNRRELGLVIKELWSAKIKNDSQKRKIGIEREKMSEFCVIYLNQKYKSLEVANEWFINIKESCKRFKSYEDAQFLLMVLNNEADEEIYHSFYESVGKLYLKMKTYGDLVSLSDFEKTLKESFPSKSSEDIQELVKEALKETNKEQFCMIKKMFAQSDDGKFNGFLKALKNQNENERIKFINRIISKLEHLEHIYVRDFLNCFKELDLSLTDVQLKSYCKWIYNETNIFKETDNQCLFIHKTEFVKRIQKVNIY